MKTKDLVQRDLDTIWHPYTQMKLSRDLIPIASGKDEFLIRENGEKIIDAVSSWWVNIHGHAHPEIAEAIAKQANTVEQVIFAGFTHKPAVELAESLLEILPSSHSKVFYSDNGSTAVEVAIKLALQFFLNNNETKPKILAIEGAYHGDTFGAMSVSGRSAFNNAFESQMFDVDYIAFPGQQSAEVAIEEFQNKVASNEYAAFIYEPLVQGAAGMRMYEADILKGFMQICSEHDILTIADEVMTGFGRTGKFFASDHIQEFQPDLICMSKGITGGFMPFGVTSCKEFIYERFLSDDRTKTFYHGHSFTANPISCAASIASIKILKSDLTQDHLKRINTFYHDFAKELTQKSSVENLKILGTIISFEYNPDKSNAGYFNSNRNRIYNHFISKNILIRPLGNVIYLIPPFCISNESLERIRVEVLSFLE